MARAFLLGVRPGVELGKKSIRGKNESVFVKLFVAY